METPTEQVIAHYLYRPASKSGRSAGTLYLVSRLEGSNVVARIDVVASGTTTAAKGISAHPSKSPATALRVVSPWIETSSRHYAKARVTIAS
ncbi:MAG: hypothetical protein ACRDVC_06670 [Acidimicrobiales bacterium]